MFERERNRVARFLPVYINSPIFVLLSFPLCGFSKLFSSSLSLSLQGQQPWLYISGFIFALLLREGEKERKKHGESWDYCKSVRETTSLQHYLATVDRFASFPSLCALFLGHFRERKEERNGRKKRETRKKKEGEEKRKGEMRKRRGKTRGGSARHVQ